jgi:hypothetical protein
VSHTPHSYSITFIDLNPLSYSRNFFPVAVESRPIDRQISPLLISKRNLLDSDWSIFVSPDGEAASNATAKKTVSRLYHERQL